VKAEPVERSGCARLVILHDDPIEVAQGFAALGARHLLAIHRGTFRLTDEAIGEPPRGSAPTGARGLPDDRLWILDVGEPRSLR
jgi:hypothetical protein